MPHFSLPPALGMGHGLGTLDYSSHSGVSCTPVDEIGAWAIDAPGEGEAQPALQKTRKL